MEKVKNGRYLIINVKNLLRLKKEINNSREKTIKKINK